MNLATHRSLMAVAAQKAQSHPADVRGPLAQGTNRYRQRLWAIHAAVVMLSALLLAALLLGAGVLTGQSADSQHEGTPPVIDSPPIDHPDPDPANPDPANPEPIDPDPTDPDPTDDTDDPPLGRIEFEPSSLTMVPDQTLTVEAWGIYKNEAREQIPAAQLSWDVERDEQVFDVPGIA